MSNRDEFDTSRKSVASDDHVARDDIAAHTGVEAVKATHKVYGKYSRWCLFIGYVPWTLAKNFLELIL